MGDLPPTVYRHCLFRRADLRSCSPQMARFEDCIFDGARLDGWASRTAEFVDCQFIGRLLRVQFWGAPFGAGRKRIRRATNEFRGNDFSRAELDDCAFVGGIDLDLNRWPTSERYVILRDSDTRVRYAAEHLDQLPVSDRQGASAVLRVLSTAGFGQKRDVIVERAFLGPAEQLLIPQASL